jgi:tRNA/tmRNA/rRNA uracil-C5-methylase (TrmA/RlmC/RlmD family)
LTKRSQTIVLVSSSTGPMTVPDDVRSDHVHELAAGRSWRISAGSFLQTRADGVDALADLVIGAADAIGPAGTAIDLYSGVGVFAGVLAVRGWAVTAVESARSAVADARANLRGLDVRVVGPPGTDVVPGVRAGLAAVTREGRR